VKIIYGMIISQPASIKSSDMYDRNEELYGILSNEEKKIYIKIMR
jgi:hypothetical protein